MRAMRLHFAVSDTGMGIPTEHLDKIFQAFIQLPGAAKRRQEGTGLGTAIARQLVEMMGGQIWIESEVGQGTTFHFTLPCEAGSDPQIAARPSLDHVAGAKILIVDDSVTSQTILRDMVASWGFAPVMVENGFEALEKVAESMRSQDPFALVLLDHEMPGMDGPTCAERIREEVKAVGLPIILLSSARRIELSRLYRLNNLSILAKPVRKAKLLQTMLTMLKGVKENAVETKSVARPQIGKTNKSLRILLVEDDPISQKLVFKLLAKRGHEVVTADDGQDAVAMFGPRTWDLILMDLEMPGMDGLEATRRIREMERRTGRGRAPIIGLSAHAMNVHRHLCLKAGMDDYLTKPVNIHDLIGKIERLIEEGHGG